MARERDFGANGGGEEHRDAFQERLNSLRSYKVSQPLLVHEKFQLCRRKGNLRRTLHAWYT